jgi:hypothetical protein
MRVMTTKHSIYLLAVIILATLFSCGGGSVSTPTPILSPEQQTPVITIITGVFVDSAVQGLNYKTASQSGKTNETGSFSYVAGEMITFSIGDIEFPEVAAGALLSPLDVFAVTDMNDIRVQNMARLLQTLDTDGTPGNGITISDDVHNQATGVAVDFGAADFDTQVMSVVANSGAVYTSLISAQNAIEHLNLTLGNTASTRSCAADSTKVGYTGTFSTLAHNVSGRATIIDNCTLEISMFNFDGAAPNVRFYAGVNGNFSGSEAFAISERIDGQSYSNETIILELPEGRFVESFDSLSVWCVEFGADFGNLRLEAP